MVLYKTMITISAMQYAPSALQHMVDKLKATAIDVFLKRGNNKLAACGIKIYAKHYTTTLTSDYLHKVADYYIGHKCLVVTLYIKPTRAQKLIYKLKFAEVLA